MTGRQFYDWQSKRIKDLADIARLVESHPHLWDLLTDDLKRQLQLPDKDSHVRDDNG